MHSTSNGKDHEDTSPRYGGDISSSNLTTSLVDEERAYDKIYVIRKVFIWFVGRISFLD